MSERPVVQAAVGAAVDLAGGQLIQPPVALEAALEAAGVAVGAVSLEAAGLPVDRAAPVVAVDLAGLALVRKKGPFAWSSP